MSRIYWGAILALALGTLPAAASVKSGAVKRAEPARAAVEENTGNEGRVLGAAERLSGKVMFVNTNTRTLTILNDGIPYDFRVPHGAKIRLNDTKSSLQALGNLSHENITVEFVPRSEGNFARRVTAGSIPG